MCAHVNAELWDNSIDLTLPTRVILDTVMPQCYGIATNSTLECPHKASGGDVILCQGDMCLCKKCEDVRFPATSRLSQERVRQQINTVAPVSTRPSSGPAGDTVPQSTSTASATPNTPLTNLCQLQELDKEVFHKMFMNNMNIIFQYTMHDIEKVLDGIALETLTPLHKTLCGLAKATFPRYSNMKAKNRIIAGTTIKDIRHLGFSLVNKSALRDLDKIFVETDQHSSNIPDLDDNMNSNQKLLETILHVQDRVTSLERKVTTLEEENLKLKQHIIQLDNGGVNNLTSTDVAQDHVSTSSSSDSHTSTAGDTPDTPIIVSDESSDSEADVSNFQYQSQYKKKVNRLNKKKKKHEQATASSVVSTKLPVRGIRSAKSDNYSHNNSISDMYIGGVHPSHSCSDITEHIKNMGVVIKRPVQVLSQKDSWCSFRVGVSADDVSTISCADNWQSGIKVRPFLAQRQPGDATNQVHSRPPRFDGPRGYNQQHQHARHQARSSVHNGHDYRQRRGNYAPTSQYDTRHARPRHQRANSYTSSTKQHYNAEMYQGEQWRSSARPAWREGSSNSYSQY